MNSTKTPRQPALAGCACGNPQVFRRTGSGKVCARCDALQRDYECRLKRAGVRDTATAATYKVWVIPDETPICGASLVWLERKLNRLAA